MEEADEAGEIRITLVAWEFGVEFKFKFGAQCVCGAFIWPVLIIFLDATVIGCAVI